MHGVINSEQVQSFPRRSAL